LKIREKLLKNPSASRAFLDMKYINLNGRGGLGFALDGQREKNGAEKDDQKISHR
jgi:hypothetical protein